MSVSVEQGSVDPRRQDERLLALLQEKGRREEIARVDGSLFEFIRSAWGTIETNEYVPGWHVGAMCEHLEAVNRGEIKNLIINVPPRHQKTLTVSVFWPAWTWAQTGEGYLTGPQVRWLFASYAQQLSLQHSIQCRRVLQSDWYRDRFGDRYEMVSDQNAKQRYENNRGGARLATSVDGALTGEGGSIIVVDDPHNVRDGESPQKRMTTLEWWDAAMSTRLNDVQRGARVVIMQRVHESDLVGHIKEQEPEKWTHLCLPARYEADHPYAYARDPRTYDGELLWPERFPEGELESLEVRLGSYGTAAQLQQRPAPREGGLFQPAWFEVVEAAPAGGRAVRSWDLAATDEASGRVSGAAYTVGVLMKVVNGFYYVLDVERFRGSPAQVEARMLSLASRDGKDVIIDFPQDPGQAGKAQSAYLTRQLAGYIVRSSPETGAKETRAEAYASQAEAGNVKLLKGNWNSAYLDELAIFPNSDYSDQVDASSRGFHQLSLPLRRRISLRAPELIEQLTGMM